LVPIQQYHRHHEKEHGGVLAVVATTGRPRGRGITTVVRGAKGFGKPETTGNNNNPKLKKKEDPPVALTTATSSTDKDDQQQEESTANKPKTRPLAASTGTTPRASSSSSSPSAGQQALQELRRQAAETRDAELRMVREIVEQDAQLAEGGPAAIPERVATRMGQRMIPFVGIPLFGGMGTFITFWYYATYRDLEFQPVLVASSTFVWLAIGLVGITYSVLSASWDEDRDNSSVLGLDEVQRNINTIRTGLSRSRDNARVRDQMARLSNDEIQTALVDLNRREQQQEQSQSQSQQNKRTTTTTTTTSTTTTPR
jgi:Photosynthesis affected mutant 68